MLKYLLFTALLVAGSCLTAAKHQNTFLKGSSSAHSSLGTRQTEWTSDGTGDVNYLAKHSIDCKADKSGAISSFQLKRNDNDQIRFEYECTPVSNIDWDACVDSYTDAATIQGTDKTSAQLLAGQTVQCQDYSVLTAFGLQTTSDGSQLRYTYTCCRASTGPCARDVTSDQQLATGNVVDLDSHVVAASNGNVLTGFALRAETSEGVITAFYRFGYCGTEQAVVRRETGSSDYGGGDIIYLDRHSVDCKSSKSGAISRFRMQRQGSENINYEYECTNAQSIDWNKCTTKTSSWTDIGSNRKESVQFLDRQNIQCDAGTALTQFKLSTNNPSNNKIRYSYTCCAAVLDNCSSAASSTQDIGQGGLVFLDRQNIKAQTGGVMTGFQLQAQYPSGHMTANYKVKSCLAR